MNIAQQDFFVDSVKILSKKHYLPILTAVESPTGTYTLTYASQTQGDTITASLAPTSGYVAPTVSDLVP